MFRKVTAVALAITTMFAPALALASAVPYVNTPLDTVQATVNQAIANINQTQTGAANLVTGSVAAAGSLTLAGLRQTITLTGFTTAQGATTSATVVNSNVAANSQVMCNVVGYSGAGVPIVWAATPTAGQYVIAVTNTNSSALNANITVACLVFN